MLSDFTLAASNSPLPESKILIVQENPNYAGLPLSSKNSKFNYLAQDPIYKFLTL